MCSCECVSVNASVAFGFLTRNPVWAHCQFIVFQTPWEISSKGIRMRYADFLTVLSIFKGTVNMNENSLGKSKMQLLFLDF